MMVIAGAMCAALLALSVAIGSTSTPDQQASGAVVRGQATWYDGTSGHAAAGPDLRKALGSGWRNSAVDVCQSGKTSISCVRVRLTDWCACSGERIIDLDDKDFSQFADLSKGVIRVEIALGAPPREHITNPPTDTE